MFVKNTLTSLDAYVINLHGDIVESNRDERLYRFGDVVIEIKNDGINFLIVSWGYYPWGVAVDDTGVFKYSVEDGINGTAQKLENILRKKIRRAGY